MRMIISYSLKDADLDIWGSDRSQSGFSQDHAYLPSKNKDRSLCRPKHNFSVKQLASHGTVAPLIFHAGYGWYPECANLYPSGED